MGDGDPILLALSQRCGHAFADPELLVRAMTHASWRNETPESVPDNERLEYLGDAVLELIISDLLFRAHPDVAEGRLTQERASLVNTRSLSDIARRLELGSCLRLGIGELKSGGATRSSNLANALEALIGAIYLDGGYLAAHGVVAKLIGDAVQHLDSKVLKDPRSELQEYTQSQGQKVPTYRVKEIPCEGAAPLFEADVKAGPLEGSGIGRTKKEAFHAAAAEALGQRGGDS